METHELERRCNFLLAKQRRLRTEDPRFRPFGIEMGGDPKAGKSTQKTIFQQFFKRIDWHVAARPEGAEAIDEIPRDRPDYNDLTFWYALTELFKRQGGKFDLILLDRAIEDHRMRQRFWHQRGKITETEMRVAEAYCDLSRIREKIDVVVLMVCRPEVSMEREVTHALSNRDGETMNLATLRALHEFHLDMYAERKKDDPRLILHDSSDESPKQTALAILPKIADAFERRLTMFK